MQFALPLLSTLVWLPIVGGLLIFALGGQKNPRLARWMALLISLVCLGLCVPLWQGFDAQAVGFQFVEHKAWFPWLNINYDLGVDGFAMPLIILTCLFTPLVIISAWEVIEQKVALYMVSFLMMQGLMCGVFAAMDAILFYVFWEAMLVPMFLIIGIWGGPNRIYATIKFFLYTFLGSVFLLVALIYLYWQTKTTGTPGFAISAFADLSLPLLSQKWILVAFLLAFAVKIPMVPVHTWLPDAHVEAPTGGSVVLAAIMLKMGGYGFLRFMLPIVPDASREWQWLIIGASLVAVVYIGLVAIVQKDMKKLIAYSSIAHMGFVTLGIFISFALLNQDALSTAAMGINGAYVQMISHGFISGALFLCVGVLYDRVHSRQIADYGGVVNTMPLFASFFVLFAMANSGLPGTSGFVGEFFVILAAFHAEPLYAFLAALTLILGAAYTLWMIKRVVFGEVSNQHVAQLTDLNGREATVLTVLAFLVLLFGIWPEPLVEVTQTTTKALLAQISQPKYALYADLNTAFN
ncbi:NADH-quinone oxidoreductase subunit M [Candidatus Berkiella aquae]|uniref:NADH-quinone oxidoreductase subunit M n=1 Tax=Candidatus Berkiella aquae TaxID=295108 RepID=A0A0Q9YXX4_9GAMM|nr:NADH-quinone oxidoreductase subunit M [Candidatus Berkiella aquae]MCS5710503.1 NADH-quinone oxidoreductase subunit M [Candidatus Berkiella aquae]